MLTVGILTLGRILQTIAQVLYVRVSTELLTPTQLGTVAQINGITGGINQIFIAPVLLYTNRGFKEWQAAGTLMANLFKCLKYVLAVAFLATCCSFFLQRFHPIVIGISPLWTAMLVAAFMFFAPIYAISVNSLNLLYHRSLFVLFTNMESWLGLGFAALFFSLYSQEVYWILGQYLGAACAASALVLLIQKLGNQHPAPNLNIKVRMPFSPAKVFSFCGPQMFSSLMWWVQSQSYRFLTAKIGGMEAVSLYFIGAVLASGPRALFESVFGQTYDPIYYKALQGQDTEGQAAAWNRYARAFLPAALLAGLFIIFSGPFMVTAFLSSKFANVSAFFIWPALTETIGLMGNSIHFIGISKIDMRIIMITTTIGAILAPAGILILGQWKPLEGTAIALCLAMAASVSAGFYIGRRVLPITLPIRRMGFACLLAIPVIIFFQIIHWAIPHPSTTLSLAVLITGALYLALAEYILAREWLVQV